MNRRKKFGENVEGYNIQVLNEREIRASAGLLFLFAFIAITLAILGDFLLLKYFIIVFLADFIVRIFVSPKFSPTLIIGRWIVRNQVPEYIDAPQKKFAWVIGLALVIIMLVLVVIVNSFSPITGLICLICLIFLFFESAFGICLGCKMYSWFNKGKVQYCPGEVCEIKDRQEIQKISKTQILIIFGFIAYIFITVFLFNDTINKKPFDLFGIENSVEPK